MPLLLDQWDDHLRKGDRLLRSSENWEQSVTFSDHPVSRNLHLWDGYITAGNNLTEVACTLEVYDRDSLIYPILHCYRHGLELAMKTIVLEYGQYAGESPKLGHDLCKVWDACRRVIVSIMPSDEGSESIFIVERLIKELNEVDSSGEAFRYSTDKKFRLIQLPDLSIDLVNLRAIAIRLNRYLGGAYDVLDMAVQHDLDMAAQNPD